MQKRIIFQMLIAFIRVDFQHDSQSYTNCLSFFATAWRRRF